MSNQHNVYGVVDTKLPREVVLLNTVGGCSWHNCAFCDYCNTFSNDAHAADRHNSAVLSKVTGIYGRLQIVCSANFMELPVMTWFNIAEVCNLHNIHTIIIESHWIYRGENGDSHVIDFFNKRDITVKVTHGIETFDYDMRERRWFKGYGNVQPEELRHYANHVNLLIGVMGQTLDGIIKDIMIALVNFEHVYVYAFESNETDVIRDKALMNQFYNSDFFTHNKTNPSLEILDGSDFRAPDHMGFVGVGAQYL